MKVGLQRAASIAASEGVLILIVGLFAAVLVANLALFFSTDTWLAFASGREVAQSGLPRTDTLTIWSAGERWVDQQWLGQLALYGLHDLGGLALVGFTHALLVIVPFAAALVIARRRGASARAIAIVGLLAIAPCLIVGGNIRTQSFAFGLFVVLLWLLSEYQRSPSNRVFWAIPVLVLWSNLHGSVALGVALVVLAAALGIFEALRGRRALSSSSAVRSGLLVAAAVGTLFASPYALSLPGYYEATLLNSQFHTLVAEWRPPELSLTWAPFFMLAATALVLLGRAGSGLTSFERLTVVATIVLALTAYRNLAWFGLAAAMLLPPAMSSGREGHPARFVAVVSGLVVVAVVIVTIASLRGLDADLQERFDARILDAVTSAAARDPSLQIYADLEYADWLLWRRPELAGRLLFDARLELLSEVELQKIARFHRQVGVDWQSAAGAARLFVLQAQHRPLEGLPTTWSALSKTPEALILHRDPNAVVVLVARRTR